MRIILAIGTFVFLTACSTETLIDTAFPGRERFAFQSSDGESVYQYACEPKGSEAATRENAKQAHVFTDREMEKIVDRAVVQTIGGERDSVVNRQIDASAERLIDTVEARFQCLAYEFRDI